MAFTPGTNITTTNTSVIKIGVKGVNSTSADMYEAANFLTGEFKDEPTVQDVKPKNTVSGLGITTYHAYSGSGTWQRTQDDPIQYYMINLSGNGHVGKDCKTKVAFVGEDGITYEGIFNVSVTEMGFSGEADGLGTLEVDFKLAEGGITVTETGDAVVAKTRLTEIQA